MDTHDEDVFYHDNLTLKNSKNSISSTFKKMCRKAGQKLSTLLRLSPYPDTTKRKTIYTTMVKSQLNYCPLVWMFCPRRFRITYNDHLKDFKSLNSQLNHYTPEKFASFND